MIYLDHAATTPVFPAALEAAWPWLTSEFGNPSSTHELGLRASAALETSRATIAEWLEVNPSEIIFTSGGTEGDNLAVIGLALANPRGRHIVSCRTEHEAIIEALGYLERAHDFEITWLPVTALGEISTDDLRSALRDDTTLVTLMVANNETGTVHDIATIAAIAHESGCLVHTDAVQAASWLDIRPGVLGVDALTISGHKLGAPKGSGALFVRTGVALEPLFHGGGQENDRRSGTENVAWAVALATVIAGAVPRGSERDREFNRMSALRQTLVTGVCAGVPEAISTGSETSRIPSIASFVFDGLGGEPLLLALEERGIIVSSGAACAAGKDDPSHVLLASGFAETLARTQIRASFAHSTSEEDIAEAIRAFIASADALRALGAAPRA